MILGVRVINYCLSQNKSVNFGGVKNNSTTEV